MILTFLPALRDIRSHQLLQPLPENQATKPRRAWASTKICWRSHGWFFTFFSLSSCPMRRQQNPQGVDVGRWDWRSRYSVCYAISSTFVVRASCSYTSTAEREPRCFGAAFDKTGERVSGASAISWGTVPEGPSQPLLAVAAIADEKQSYGICSTARP